MKYRLLTQEAGFTLVELSIVMIIIGLLVGGVLKGYEMVQMAEETSMVKQVESYRAATVLFRDTYASLPGDLRSATSRVKNCNAATFCQNGNSDGKVGPLEDDNSENMISNSENNQYWKHMALNDYITGVDPQANPAVSPQWGGVNPASLGGGLQILYVANTNDGTYGHYMRLQRSITGPIQTGVQGAHAISPVRANRIDRKYDDGSIATGFITSEFAGSRCKQAGRYTTALTDNCIMLFKIF